MPSCFRLTEDFVHREEYLLQFSIYVLESCTSRRLTYFLPPTNLLPLLFVRPLRLFLPSNSVRHIRVMLLRAVSIPFVALIWCYEGSSRLFSHSDPHPPLARIRSRPLSASKPTYGLPRFGELGMASARKSASPPRTNGTSGASLENASSTEDKADLIVLVQRLSTQVDELTAMVAAQKAD